MFTGIVEERGVVGALDAAGGAARLEVRCEVVTEGAQVGESIAVNGCCVTITELTRTGFAADLMGETLARTALGDAQAGGGVNLERALRPVDRLGGHLVQGHVDGVTTIRSVLQQGEQTTMEIALPAELARYVAEKGSVAVDGVSLTVARVDDDSFAVGVIPHTLAVTTLGERQRGDRVNIEVDVLAKYVARLTRQTGEAAEEER